MVRLYRKLKRMERARNDSAAEKRRWVRWCDLAISKCDSWANSVWQAYDGDDDEAAYLWMDFICSNYKEFKKEVDDMCEAAYDELSAELSGETLPIGIALLA